ncbi:glycosyltransferase [Streptomyces sp. N2-109]|uniref:Glycosyltransferase n=1 Tax=Streptomyces gossypii TaxID=2883101 RepID=A0ABT2JYN3_9ACTN|nr:glycosyltransferase [Streptomyces gossypii]MCT2592951.1 glycosyltransferase [Streptomyces gossypii]MCT2593684.1 glycosyltransferase [Streptomyces gossypii]
MTESPSAPELSVVVITRDDETSLRRLVASLGAAGQVTDASYEIIVVDDGSTPSVRADLAELTGGVPLLLLRRGGAGNRSAARAEGAERARGRVLAFVDSDQEAPAHWVAEHLRWQRAFPSAVVAGHRRHRDEPGSSHWRPEVRTRVTAEFSQNYARIAGAWYLPFGCNLSVPTALYHELGGHSDIFVGWGYEDHDFGYRAWAAGTRTVHNPFAWTWDQHHVVRTDGDRVAEWEANRARFLAAHPDPHAQAVRLIDNYPSGEGSSPGQMWMDSFRQFDAALRLLDDIPDPAPPTRTLTVLSPVDAAHARTLLYEDVPLRIVDGLPGSDLDLEVQREDLTHIEYHALLS